MTYKLDRNSLRQQFFFVVASNRLSHLMANDSELSPAFRNTLIDIMH